MTNYAQLIQEVAILTPPILLAITCHEVAHGYIAFLLGDRTAKDAGRLTLNPIKHIDIFGAIALFLVKVGWAKPVPINPSFFKNPRQGIILVSLAGPVTNFLLALISTLALKFLFFGTAIHIFSVQGPLYTPFVYMLQASVLVNIGLGFFNLIPIPPLDGSNILAGLLPPKAAQTYIRYSKFGLLILILLFLTGSVQKLILPIINFFAQILLNITL